MTKETNHKTYTYKEVIDENINYFNGDKLAAEVVISKYLLKDDKENYYEKNPTEMFKNRIAPEFARIEKQFTKSYSEKEECEPVNTAYSEEEIFQAFDKFKYIIPQGGPLYGIGNKFKSMSLGNCFAIENPYDSYGGILKSDQEIVQIAKRRGGIGVDISTIRPKGLKVDNAALTTDGIEVFMQRFSNTTHEVAQCIAKGQHVITENNGLTKIEDVKVDDKVWTKIGFVKVLNILKNKKEITKLVTKRGYEIKTSADHILLSTDANNIIEKKMSDFNTTDSIVLLTGVNVSKPYIKLNNVDYISEDGGEKGLEDSDENSSELNAQHRFPDVLDEKLAYILGFSYGCEHKNPEIEQKTIEQKITKLYQDVFNITPSSRQGEGSVNEVDMHSKAILHFLNINGLLKQYAHGMIFPEPILNSASHVQSAFIAGYFDACGCVNPQRHNYSVISVNYSIASASYDFLHNVQKILLQNKIVSIKHSQDIHTLSVCGKYAQENFVNYLNGWSEKVNNKAFASDRDECITPYFPSSLGIKCNKCNDNQRMSCSAYDKYSKNHEKLDNMLILDSVREIIKTNIEEETFDLVLEQEHLFWCEGFYVHNSGRRGALMIAIDCHHPQILDFIRVKKDKTKVTGANISVKFTNDFFEALQNKTTFTLKFPVNADIKDATVVKECNPEDIWNEFIESNWSSAEPGCLFWDNLINDSISDCYADSGFKTIVTNPCGELPLSAYNSCILMALNLNSFVSEPYTKQAHIDFVLFEKYVRMATHLMDDLIELEKEKVEKIIQKIRNDKDPAIVKNIELNLWEKILELLLKGRRVGLGVTGLADMLASLCIKYDSDESLNICEKLFSFMHEINFNENAILAKQRGSFECWDWEKEKDNSHIKILSEKTQNLIKTYGRRNISLSTIAPAGSISIASQTSSGVEPVFKAIYSRRKKITQEEEKRGVQAESKDSDGNKWTSFEVRHHGLLRWSEVTGNTKYEDSPYYKCTAKDIDWKYRVKLQGVIQKYITHSISSTTNLHKNTTKEEVAKLYTEAWKNNCKGITIYRDGSRDSVLSDLDTNESLSITNTSAPKRPKVLECEIHYSNVLNTDKTINKWIFFVGLLNDRPYEIFGGMKENIEIPTKYKKGWLIKNGKNEKGFSTYDLYLGSIEESEDRMIIKDIVSVFHADVGSYSRLISTQLRHGIPIHIICEQLIKDEEAELFCFEKSVARVLKKYIKDNTTSTNCCPQCKQQTLVYKDGCKSCMSCAWSMCG